MAAPRTVQELLELIEKSGLVAGRRLEDFLFQAGDALAGLDALAARLAGDGLLTSFQIEQLLQGKWRGFLLGNYKVLEPLGVGGMGRVFLCEHTVMGRRAAVKILPSNQSTEASVQRFYREARAAGAMEHPNIVRAYDIDCEGEVLYLVMEYVEGLTLGELVRRDGPLKFGCAAEYIRQAALGLQHTHDLGWVHGDVKPDNLLVTPQGIVKILDLGLARSLGDETDRTTQQIDEKTILGTVDYLAPEQVSHALTVDGRADVYSLGATFYFLLSGRTPFPGGSLAEKLVWRLADERRPLDDVLSEAPKELAAVLERMLARDPAQRYQTPREVAEVLVPWSEGRAVSDSGPPSQELADQGGPPAAREAPPTVACESNKGKQRIGKPGFVSRGRLRWVVNLVLLFLVSVGAWLSARHLPSGANGPASAGNSPLEKELQPPLSAASAARRIDENVLVEMEVASLGVSRSGSTFFLNSEADFQDPNNFTIVIHKNTIDKLFKAGNKDPRASFLNKVVRARGTVHLYNDRPEIVVNDPRQIQIVEAR